MCTGGCSFSSERFRRSSVRPHARSGLNGTSATQASLCDDPNPYRAHGQDRATTPGSTASRIRGQQPPETKHLRAAASSWGRPKQNIRSHCLVMWRTFGLEPNPAPRICHSHPPIQTELLRVPTLLCRSLRTERPKEVGRKPLKQKPWDAKPHLPSGTRGRNNRASPVAASKCEAKRRKQTTERANLQPKLEHATIPVTMLFSMHRTAPAHTYGAPGTALSGTTVLTGWSG